MTITPKPEQEQILAEAIQAGLVASPEDALDVGLEVLRSRLATHPSSETVEERVERFHTWVHSHSTSTPLLSDEAVSRESIYRDCGL